MIHHQTTAYLHINISREAYKLNIIQRQSGESEEQRVFRDIILRLRGRESTLDDWKILAKRFEKNLNH